MEGLGVAADGAGDCSGLVYLAADSPSGTVHLESGSGHLVESPKTGFHPERKPPEAFEKRLCYWRDSESDMAGISQRLVRLVLRHPLIAMIFPLTPCLRSTGLCDTSNNVR
jgi:hypothetical protein